MTVTTWFIARLFDPTGGRPPRGHRLVSEGGVWREVTPVTNPTAADVVVADDLVVPGIVDLHVHVGRHFGPFAVSPQQLLATGATTGCSQGDVGAPGYDAWAAGVRVTETAQQVSVGARCVLAINVAPPGECGGSAGLDAIDWSSRAATAAALDQLVERCGTAPDRVRMIAVNLSARARGRTPVEPALRLACRTRDLTGLPLLVGLAEDSACALGWQLAQLEQGDVVTYCFRSAPWTLFPDGDPLDELLTARRRGVLLDTGHGVSSFDQGVARAALRHEIVPDTISSDLQVALLDEHGIPTVSAASVMGLLHDHGVPLTELIPAITSRPAGVLRLSDGTGVIRQGGRADLSALSQGPRGWSAKAIALEGRPLVDLDSPSERM